MNIVVVSILASLLVFAAAFILYWCRLRSLAKGQGKPRAQDLLVGGITNFFDALGVGSFAPTTAYIKFRKVMSDDLIPGTLNIGHCLPSIAQAFIFITIVNVDIVLLIGMLAAAVIGSWLGAGIVSRLPRRSIQLGMGVALMVASILFLMKNLDFMPNGGIALALYGWKFWFAIIGNLILGALMTLGIGMYAPCLIMLSLLGMNPLAAFPIMMGSCAFLMPVGSIRFLQSGRYDLRFAMGLALGGIPGVLIAAFLVKSLPLEILRWMVIIVVIYAAFMMLRSTFQKEAS